MMKASAMNLTAPLVAWSEDTMSPESPSTLNTKVNKMLPKARRTREFSAFAKVIAWKQLQKVMVKSIPRYAQQKKICRQTADSGPIKKKIKNKQIKRTYLDNQAVRWRQMSKRFQVSAPLFDFGQLLRSPFHWNSLWWKWWFTSIQTAGSFSVEVLRWSVWLGASPWWIFWLQW